MLRYATWITQPDRTIPLLGSSVTLDVGRLDPQVYGALGRLDPQFQWVRTGGAQGVAPAGRIAAFPASGQVVLRSGFGPPGKDAQQTSVLFNVGRYRTSHSQYDELSLTLFAAGRELLPDSGLFTYAPGRDFAYFHGTRAHNTVVVDGADERRGAGRLGATLHGPGWVSQTGSHTLYAGVTHTRSVVVLGKGIVLVVDELRGTRSHDYEQTWHLFPGAQLRRSGLDTVATNASGRPLLAIHEAPLPGAAVTALSGSLAPYQGWVSELYGKKTPAWAVQVGSRSINARFTTLLTSGDYAAQPAAVSADGGSGALHVSIRIGAAQWHVTISRQGLPGEQVAVSSSSS